MTDDVKLAALVYRIEPVRPDNETEELPTGVPVEFDEKVGGLLIDEPVAVEVGI